MSSKVTQRKSPVTIKLSCFQTRSSHADCWQQERCELSFFAWGLWEVSSRHASRTWKHAGHDAVAGRVGVAMVISWGGHSPSLTLTEKIMLPACLSTDVATNRRDIRSSGNKANVHARAKVYETETRFSSRAITKRQAGQHHVPRLTHTFRSSSRILKITPSRCGKDIIQFLFAVKYANNSRTFSNFVPRKFYLCKFIVLK